MRIGSKLISLLLVLTLCVGLVSAFPAMATDAGADANDATILKENKELRLWYDEPAPDDDSRPWQYAGGRNSGWETLALALGNSYMGAKVFGLTERERIQLSENSLSTSGGTQNSGTTNFAETYLHFDHTYSDVTGYERDLILNDATSHVTYSYGGVTYEREYFTSYPDKVMVIKLAANEEGKVNFTLEPKIPFYAFEGRTGDVVPTAVSTEGDTSVATLTLGGNLPGNNISSTVPGYTATGGTVGYDMDFEAQYRVFAKGGTMTTGYSTEGGAVDSVDEYSNGTITVNGADSAYIIIALGTNYELDPQVFLQGNNSLKLDGFAHPHEKVTAMIDAASEKSYDELRETHIADYTELFSRVALNLTDEVPELTTDALLDEYRAGNYSRYAEELLFAFGRYTLIASSRAGNLPPNLNGIWNMYHNAICLNGYWGNVNIQMNFWSAFNTDLAECFESYVDLYNAYIEGNTAAALAQLKKQGSITSDAEAPGYLWSIETGMTPFKAPATHGGRDGWGNTPFMAESFWDYYDYTRDESILAEVALPALMSSAAYLSLVMEYDEETGLYLTPNSGSPEQSTTSPFIDYVNKNPGYVPVGSTYDQSLTYSNYLHVLEAVELYGEDNLTDAQKFYLEKIREQVDHLDPIPVGLSGQVKEFREENYYGEIGEPDHRHISHLATLYPGSVINGNTPAWLDAAEFSLDSRGDSAIWGWSNVHRILGYARTLNGNAAYNMINSLLVKTVADNMWTVGGGNFQVEANLGAPSAMAEMLLQSHNGYIAPLAALPDAWDSGSYSGLVARGNFSVGAAWENGLASKVSITSRSGEKASVYYPGIANATLTDSDGNKLSFTKENRDLISFNTEAGKTYIITGFEAQSSISAPETLGYSSSALGSYNLAASAVEGATKYNLYVAVENAPTYTLVDSSVVGQFAYTANEGEENSRTTFAVTAVNSDGRESERTLCYYNPQDLSAQVIDCSASVLDDGKFQITVQANGNTAKYKLYSTPKSGGNYTLITESVYPIINVDEYNSSLYYYVSVVNFYDSTESEKMLVNKFGALAENDYYAANILKGKTFVAGSLASKTHTGVHSGVTVYYDYTKLTDANMHYQTGRYSTVSNDASQVFDGSVDLGAGYILDELRIYDFNGKADSANFAGAAMEIKAYSLGKWTTVASCSSNAEILTHRVSNYLLFDLGGVRAEKIAIYIPERYSTNSISINEIECSGVLDNNGYEYTDNLLLDKSFVPTDEAAKEVHIDASGKNYDYGYPVITDGVFTVAGGRFSTKAASATQMVDATVDLGGRFKLGEIRFYDYNGQLTAYQSNPTYLGTELLVQVYNNGEWTNALECVQADYASHRVFVSSTAGGAYLAFNLDGITAEKIRVYIPSNVSGNSISFYEIECDGYSVGDAAVVGDSTEILSGKEFVPGKDAAYCHNSTTGYDGDYGYAKLTDGVFNYRNGRMSTKSGTTHIFDASVEFGGAYKLDKIWLYDYNGQLAASWNSPTFAGKDLRIDALVDGVWVTVVDCTQAEFGTHRGGGTALYGAYLEFDLGDVVAEGLRIYQSGGYGGNAISYHEIKLFGNAYTYPENLSNRDNIFAGLTGVSTSGTASAGNPLSNLFDGDAGSYAEVTGTNGSFTVTLDFGEVKVLKNLKIFEEIGESNLLSGALATASDATTIEVYRDGVWLTVYKDISLGTDIYTELDMFGVDVAKVRFTFKNTRLFDGESEYRCALISETSCTTATEPIDRTALLQAYKDIENTDTSSVFGLSELKKLALSEYIAYLMDLSVDQATVDSYTAQLNAYAASLTAGAPVTDAYGDFTSYNLSLEGDIGFNFYAELSVRVLDSFPDAFVFVEYADGTSERLYLKNMEKGEDGRYLVKLNMAAAEMADTVKMRLILDTDNCGKYIEQSVKNYASNILGNSAYEEAYPGINNLITSMLNYGAYAQTYFGHNTDNLANSEIDGTLGDVTENAKAATSGEATGLTMDSWTISLESVVDAKVYFTLGEGYDVDNYTATLVTPAGTTAPLDIEDMGTRYRVVIEEIPSGYLDDCYTVVLTNNLDGTSVTIEISAMCYVSRVLSSSTDENLVNLAKALKLYADGANGYYYG